MTHILIHSLEHAFSDSLKILPFLFITYIFMEFLEKKAGEKTNLWLEKAGKAGPVVGGALGVIPQCGMSAVASNLYAGRIISVGTLLAIFLSTSDEMLPIMISKSVEPAVIAKILVVKVVIAISVGILVDFIYHILKKKEQVEIKIHDFCEHEHCHCEDGILKSAVRHTLQIFIFVLLITVVLNIGIEIIGEEQLADFILNKPILGPVLAGVIGLIPNCASSVVITQMFLDGLMSFGTMMAGLLVGAGVGILVLLRVNENKAENFKIMGILYLTGVLCGILFNVFS
ncbi:MAG: arsenic efflux protein [Lachnospiraceae bacterium]|nr:arsenic efflux protein [Lachnospiraceae bacterium]